MKIKIKYDQTIGALEDRVDFEFDSISEDPVEFSRKVLEMLQFFPEEESVSKKRK